MSKELLHKTAKLVNGAEMPLLGLGTWKLKGDCLKSVIEEAIKLGLRHIDCAAIYENEVEIGVVLENIFKDREQFNITRKDLFIVSKLWNTMHGREDVEVALNKTLNDLKLDYIDLYLIHWPFSFEGDEKGYSKCDENGVAVIKPISISETWQAMEELVKKGKVKAIGVSNFTISHLEELNKYATIKPAINQVEMHPYLPQNQLLQYCQQNGIQVTAYSPLGAGKKPSLLEDPVVVKVAHETKTTPAQALISWALSRGTGVIPKTSSVGRLRENANVNPLEDESMRQINEDIKIRLRYVDPVNMWKRDCFDDSN